MSIARALKGALAAAMFAVGTAQTAAQTDIEAMGFRNIGNGLCATASYTRGQGTDRVGLVMDFEWASPDPRRQQTERQCATYCAGRADCWGFNKPWISNSGTPNGCVIYKNHVATVATRPFGYSGAANNGQVPGPNATMDAIACYRKNTDVVDVEYVALPGRSPWVSARERCIALGGDLASIHSEVHSRNATAVMIQARLSQAWIGLHDVTSARNRYEWSDGTGNIDLFSTWKPGYPQHRARYTGAAFDCVAMLGTSQFSRNVGTWMDQLCDGIGRDSTCATWLTGRPADGRTRLVSQNRPSVGSCQQEVIGNHPDANGVTYVAGGACYANYGMTAVDEGPDCDIQITGGNDNSATNLRACTGECDADSQCASGLLCGQRDDGDHDTNPIPGCTGAPAVGEWDYCYNPACTAPSAQTCQLVPQGDTRPGVVGFLCGIPTGRTTPPTAGTPSPPPSTGPTPWYEAPGHQTNFSEVQSRLTAAELAVSEMRAEMSAVTGDVSRIRAALLAAVDADPSISDSCSGATCQPAVSADASNMILQAPLGRVAIESDNCGVDDLCASASFAATLKEALRDV